jgi:acetyl esterase/lipase
MSRWTERLYRVPNDVLRQSVCIGELAHEWLIPQGADATQVLFHIHGGGFVFPLYDPERYTTAYLARSAGVRALLVDYRLAPENPFPAAIEDCIGAYRWLVTERDVPPERVVFTGESAGGNLVVTTLLALRESGDPLPAGAVSICPVFDFEAGGTFYTQRDPMLHPDFVIRQLAAYRGQADPRTPLLCPLYADLQGLPPILLQVGGDELLREGTEAFAARAEEAGVEVTLRVWPRMWHFWHLFAPWLPEAREAMTEIRDFVLSLRRAAVAPGDRPAW